MCAWVRTRAPSELRALRERIRQIETGGHRVTPLRRAYNRKLRAYRGCKRDGGDIGIGPPEEIQKAVEATRKRRRRDLNAQLRALRPLPSLRGGGGGGHPVNIDDWDKGMRAYHQLETPKAQCLLRLANLEVRKLPACQQVRNVLIKVLEKKDCRDVFDCGEFETCVKRFAYDHRDHIHAVTEQDFTNWRKLDFDKWKLYDKQKQNEIFITVFPDIVAEAGKTIANAFPGIVRGIDNDNTRNPFIDCRDIFEEHLAPVLRDRTSESDLRTSLREDYKLDDALIIEITGVFDNSPPPTPVQHQAAGKELDQAKERVKDLMPDTLKDLVQSGTPSAFMDNQMRTYLDVLDMIHFLGDEIKLNGDTVDTHIFRSIIKNKVTLEWTNEGSGSTNAGSLRKDRVCSWYNNYRNKERLRMQLVQ